VRGSIAIVGFAGRFPSARNVSEFWRNTVEGRDCITTFSEAELLRAGVDAAELADPNYVKAAPLLADADCFDAEFFQYSPKEAALMDPQHRVFLECCWEAMEHAGYTPGQRCGVFGASGANISSYGLAYAARFGEELGQSGGLCNLASDKDYLTTRVSYKLRLRGPSVSIQTACSSSLAAVHLARMSLLANECDMALAGGVSVRVPLTRGYRHVPGGILSSDGRCRVFDAAADGTVFGSGVGVVVLRRLEDAIASGDRIYAVVRGSALNNDGGRKSSYSSPSIEGQAEAIRAALDAAEVASAHYLELHGTGTRVGDPIEVAAFRAALGDAECFVGSAKASIGHLDAASGVAGLIKALMVVDRRVVPPIPHLRSLNPAIEPGRFVFPSVAAEWTGEGPMRACVNSLGMGGTNAHVVVEGYQRSERKRSAARPVIVLSAATKEALEVKAREIVTVAEHPEDVAFTAAVGRAALPERLAIRDGAVLCRARAKQRPKVAFLFSGQGGHEGLKQVGLYDLQRELVERWAKWGVTPDVVVGHSAGEFAAAATAGVFDWDAGRRLIARRAELMEALPAGGAMAALLASEAPAGVEIAAENAPGSIVVTGDEAAVEVALARGTGQRLPVAHAFHSYRMEPMLGEWEAFAAGFAGRTRSAVWISTLTGDAVTEVDGRYWRAQVRERVRYQAAVERAMSEGCEIFLEIGPESTLLNLGKRCAGGAAREWIASLPAMDEAASRLWCLGAPVDWNAVLGSGRRVPLPAYPFARQRHWLAEPKPALRRITSPLLRSMVFEQQLASTPSSLDEILPALGLGEVSARHVVWERPGIAGTVVAQAVVTPQAEGVHGFEWFVRPVNEPDGWKRLAQAQLAAGKAGDLLYETVWRKQSRTSGRERWRVVTAGNDPEWEQRVASRIESGGEGVVFVAGAPSDIVAGQARVHHELLRLARSERKLLVVTRGAWAAAGFCRVLANEHPELGAARIEVGDGVSFDHIAAEIAASRADRESEIELRADGRYVRRLVPAAVPALRPLRLNPEAAYVIAGGSGGLGRETAQWLVEKGARRLVLMQRSAASLDVDAEVTVERLDIADEAAMRAAFARIRGPIGGVVHAAGLMDQGLIGSLDPAQVDRVFAARIAGAWNLHLATEHLPLDFFLLYSSLSAALGIVGLSTYAASHSFLDTLAEYRRARGLPALSVQWSAWEDVGLGKLIGVRNDQFRSHGGQRLPKAEAFDMLERLMASQKTVAAVFRMEWQKLAAQFPEGGTPRFLGEILGESAHSPSVPVPDARSLVLKHLSQTLQLPEHDGIAMDRPLTELGLDSMLAIELRNHLGRAFQRQLPATILFNYPTARELVRYFSEDGERDAERRLSEKVAALAAREWR
jgi:acyl transferase domain-containing protein/acyl carrier protein